jgi:hypothetical protein
MVTGMSVKWDIILRTKKGIIQSTDYKSRSLSCCPTLLRNNCLDDTPQQGGKFLTLSLRHPLVSYVIPFSFYFYISTPLEAFLVLNFHLRGSILEHHHLAVISYNKLIALSFPYLHSHCILQPILGSLSFTSIRVPGILSLGNICWILRQLR